LPGPCPGGPTLSTGLQLDSEHNIQNIIKLQITGQLVLLLVGEEWEIDEFDLAFEARK